MSEDTWELELPPGLDPLDHQIVGVNRTFGKWEGGDSATLLLLPTGAGKTVAAAMAIQKSIHEWGWKALFVAQRRKLVQQAASTFHRFGFVTAVEMAQQREKLQAEAYGEHPDVVVATVQTLSGYRLLAMDRARFQMIIIDECHHSLGAPYADILDWFEGYKLLGLTATPDGSRKNLGNRFQSVAYKLTIRAAIERGVIAPIKRRLVKARVNLRDLRVTRDDFSDGELAARILPAIEGLAHNIKIRIGDRPTVVFTPDLGTASAMSDMLRKMGISAKYIAGSAGKYGMPEAERNQVEAEFAKGDFQVIVSCDLLSEGWDSPRVSCVVICRPTMARWKYVQMVGRGFRICEGKENLLVIDFDWTSDEDAKELCTAYTLFADSVSEETQREVDRRAHERGETDTDLLKEIEEIEKERRFVREVKIHCTGKYSETWEDVESDPVGVGKILDLGIRKGKEMNPAYGGGDATENQLFKLKSLGINNAWGMSKWGASKMISKLEARHKQGMASHQQVRDLLKAGMDSKQARSLSAREAAGILSKGAKVFKQGEMF